MSDFKIRTENIKPSEILDYFVETPEDRLIVDRLKSSTPVILVGSRGVGKSFLLRVAEAELKNSFEESKVLPVYISFSQGSVLQLNNEIQFYQWMLARICSSVLRSLKKNGVVLPNTTFLHSAHEGDTAYLSKLISEFESSWKGGLGDIDVSALPSIDNFKDSIEDICEESGISYINIFIDEAAHILRPAQQRQFFGIYRDLSSAFINCNAAVYPGVTSFGDYFQPIHDALFINLERDPTSSGYIETMRSMVEKQADSKLMASIAKNMENFSILAFSATGNPRILLKTIGRSPSISSKEVNSTIREFYKNDIWEEHSLLSDKYPGFSQFINWGRTFLEETVIPEIKSKNDSYLQGDKKTSRFFWVNRKAPKKITAALNLLCYTGIISLHSEAMKATRSEIGARYSVNIGCLLAQEVKPAATGFAIVKNIYIKRMTEYGAYHEAFESLASDLEDISDTAINQALQLQLSKSVDFLDLPLWLIDRLKSINLHNIKDVLDATEETIQKAYYVGEARSRYIKNEALSAVFEYMAG
ncbi:MAG: hypothetical protein Q7U38_11050 [Methylobacter sp.]|nr:hypothetical protein [Methylobacter sp.]MDP2098288.1 hypothetical protein [Methylobacter sp.]MDP2426785.1 hypothetical protein [Methylobacter sp.]MDP3054665.1 hypothetical protein [Methylobacter sp.]MDP3361717.1 hypothetical protein [Methylobacter sp.]